MKSSTAPAVRANGKMDGSQRFSAEDKAQLDQLVALWRTHRRQGLEIRHQTGVFLNQRLGEPTVRQRYGGKVLKSVGKRLKISESELSRMRWLAHLATDLAGFQKKHPEIDSWMRFKRALPNLKPPKGDEAKGASRDRSNPPSGGIVKPLKSLTKKLRRMGHLPGGKRGEALRETLRELIEVAQSFL
jgi:hypothetical protein